MKEKFLDFFQKSKNNYKDNLCEFNEGYIVGMLFSAIELNLISVEEAKELTSDTDICIEQLIADYEELIS